MAVILVTLIKLHPIQRCGEAIFSIRSTMTKLPKSIFDLLDVESFRKRTAMYIGGKRITLLRAFVDGYFYATQANGIEVDDKVKIEDFHDWVASHFKWKESTAGWTEIILKECNGDESLALDTFFELYDIFKTRER